jgi:hypothetical protein
MIKELIYNLEHIQNQLKTKCLYNELIYNLEHIQNQLKTKCLYKWTNLSPGTHPESIRWPLGQMQNLDVH